LELSVFLAALFSAILHAGWNAATRTRPDPGTAYASVVMMAGFVALPILIAFGLPSIASLPYAAAATAVNIVATRLIMATYRQVPFSVGYPVTRGVTPIIVAAVGVLVLGDPIPSGPALGGILLISMAVLLLAQSGSKSEPVTLKGLSLAIGAGISIALFIVFDARGARLSGNPIGYAALMAIIIALLTPLMLLVEGLGPKKVLKGHIRFGLIVSTVSTLSYILVTWGLANGPVGPVAALRETSVLFAMAIAAFMLKERLSFRRIFAGVIAVIGIALLRLS
jgi:drug/metabolite transporter (DMT)-like permease